MLGLLLIMLANRIRCLEQLYSSRILAHQHIAQVLRKASHEITSIEALLQHLVEQQQCATHIARKSGLHQTEIVVRIQHIQHLDCLLIADIRTAERDQLVKDTQRIAHTAIGLLCHHIQCFFRGIHAFLLGYILQVTNGIRHGDSAEIIHLATTQNGR